MGARSVSSAASRHGITILELLLALAVVGILLALSAAAISTGARLYQANDRVVSEAELSAAVRALMAYDISLVGYRCVDSDAPDRGFVGGAYLRAINEVPARGEVIRVRYFEDRDEIACALVEVAYFVGTEQVSSGRVGLVRTESVGGGGVTRALVTDRVATLRVFREFDGAGIARSESTRTDIGALSIELGFVTGGGERFVVATPNLLSYDAPD